MSHVLCLYPAAWSTTRDKWRPRDHRDGSACRHFSVPYSRGDRRNRPQCSHRFKGTGEGVLCHFRFRATLASFPCLLNRYLLGGEGHHVRFRFNVPFRHFHSRPKLLAADLLLLLAVATRQFPSPPSMGRRRERGNGVRRRCHRQDMGRRDYHRPGGGRRFSYRTGRKKGGIWEGDVASVIRLVSRPSAPPTTCGRWSPLVMEDGREGTRPAMGERRGVILGA